MRRSAGEEIMMESFDALFVGCWERLLCEKNVRGKGIWIRGVTDLLFFISKYILTNQIQI